MTDDKTVADYAAKGGKARAKALSKEERKEIARQAARTRWGTADIPREKHSGIIRIGDMEIPCAVLDDGKRVLSERGVVKALGGKRGGAHWRRRKAGGANLPIYASANNLKPFIDSELLTALTTPTIYITRDGGNRANGLDGTLLPKVCDIWLKARDAAALHHSQLHIADKADMLIRGFAHVGIIALIDEATGYQDARAKDALAKILEEFIAEEIRKWVKTFPDEFYKEMFRLRSWEYPPASVRKPRLVGNLTNNVVYRRLAPGVLDELKRKTPRDEKGRHKTHLHRRLSEEVGHPRLREHLAAVIALMKASSDWDGFMHMLNMALPKYNTTKLLEFK